VRSTFVDAQYLHARMDVTQERLARRLQRPLVAIRGEFA
jgi:hypothetical protein